MFSPKYEMYDLSYAIWGGSVKGEVDILVIVQGIIVLVLVIESPTYKRKALDYDYDYEHDYPLQIMDVKNQY